MSDRPFQVRTHKYYPAARADPRGGYASKTYRFASLTIYHSVDGIIINARTVRVQRANYDDDGNENITRSRKTRRGSKVS